MKIQLALDLVRTEEALKMTQQAADLVDIVEVGTPMIIREGMAPVRALKARFPHLTVLADTKIMDGGAIESADAFEAGADLVTVLAVADDATIRNVVATAKKYGRQAMADMICVKNVEERARELDEMGLDYVCVHTATDVQKTGRNPLAELETIVSVLKNAKAAVAGGISQKTIGAAVKTGAQIVVVGSALTSATDLRAAAKALLTAAKEESK